MAKDPICHPRRKHIAHGLCNNCYSYADRHGLLIYAYDPDKFEESKNEYQTWNGKISSRPIIDIDLGLKWGYRLLQVKDPYTETERSRAIEYIKAIQSMKCSGEHHEKSNRRDINRGVAGRDS